MKREKKTSTYIKKAEGVLIEEKKQLDVSKGIMEVKDLLNKRNFLLAKERCLEILNLNLKKEERVELKFYLSLSYLALKQYQKAVEELKDISRFTKSKRYPDAIFLLGRIYEEKFKNYKIARKYYKIYLDRFPDGRMSWIARRKLLSLK